MKLFNSLTKTKEEFRTMQPNHVGMYTCGPTVYNYVTIGNWRTYTLGDILLRTFKYLGYDVKYIMNITDVGHLTGDNLGDADTGEDRLEKAAKKENKTAWDIAQHYTDDFLSGYKRLNLTEPEVFCKATDHIAEQIVMVQEIEAKGFAYKISDGIYFDTKAYESAGNIYGELSNIDQVKEGARVEPNPEKKDPRDFALWKFSYQNGRDFDPATDKEESRRHMEWPSPLGLGFPGWHIECSAMSRKYLGAQFDIHVGGEDLRSTHHPNEIAQAEAASGKKPFVRYWVHGAFLQVNGGRMGKSLGNAYTIDDVVSRGFNPLHLRYFYLTGYYRQPLNFTWESLENAKKGYEKLAAKVEELLANPSTEGENNSSVWEASFRLTLENDLNMPKALAVVWDMLKSGLNNNSKLELLLKWDSILGFKLDSIQKTLIIESVGKLSANKIFSKQKLPVEILSLVDSREVARNAKDWQKSDILRAQLQEKGYVVSDKKLEVLVEKK